MRPSRIAYAYCLAIQHYRITAETKKNLEIVAFKHLCDISVILKDLMKTIVIKMIN